MPAHVPTIASGAIHKLVSTLTEVGIDPGPVLAEVALDASVVDDRDARVPIAKLHRIWDAVLRGSSRADWAVLGAEHYSPGDYGLVGFVAMNSATLGEAVRHVVRYVGLWTDDPSMELRNEGTLAVAYRADFVDSPGFRLATEAAPAEILNGARVLTQRRITPREVRFPHPAPRNMSVYESFFGCPVRFGAPDIALVFREEDMALPLPRADEQLGAYLRTVANEALARRTGAQSTPLDRIRQIIAEELQKGVPALDGIAKRMATSERTLRRRLEENGTSFRTLLDETRAELARGYVRDRNLPLSEVAFLLGFSEPSAFHRAFKRWTDTTPAAWRAREGR
jgi:AraC-like DNA-binding protein